MVSARDTTFRCGTLAAGQGGGGEFVICLFTDNYELLLILRLMIGGRGRQTCNILRAKKRKPGIIYIHKLQSINGRGRGWRQGEEEGGSRVKQCTREIH